MEKIIDAKNLWDKVKNIFFDKISHEKDFKIYKIWLESVEPFIIEENKLIVQVKNPELKDYLNNKIIKFLNSILFEIDNNKVIEIISKNTVDLDQLNYYKTEVKEVIIDYNYSNLNSRYTFDNFIQGESNRWAYTVSNAVADNPGIQYNPLFIYGGVGLGKTHLLNAIGHKLLKRNPKSKVIYTPAEEFLNQLLYSIRTRSQAKFRNKYRDLNLLLIDDVQSLVRGDQAQEEFFHTFNSLYTSNNQIVFSSDRPPNEIKKLHERLISRMQQGIVIEIKPPNYETRKAILQQYAKNERYEVNEKIIDIIATNVKKNIRILEGSLTRIASYISTYIDITESKQLEEEEVLNIIKDIIDKDKNIVTFQSILKIVSDYYDISERAIKGKKRQKSIIHARQIAMYLIREELDMTLTDIGHKFGKKDHTTVRHAIIKIEEKIQNDNILKNEIIDLKRKIK